MYLMALVPEKIPQSRPPIILQFLQSGPIKVQTCMSDMHLDFRIFYLKAVRLFKCRANAEISRQSGFTQTLET